MENTNVSEKKPPHEPQKIHIVFVINGEDVPVESPTSELLADARDAALKKSKNTARPFSDWEITNDKDAVLDPSRIIASFDFPKKVKLFLNVAVGAGG